MQHTTEAPKKYQCRHIFTDGRRCSSPCLRQQEFCYYHHTTRRPVANPTQRRSRRSTFHLPLPEDRSAIQASIGEVLQRIAANDIDPRRAGLLLYGLQIASLNLPKPPAHRNAKPEPVEFVEEITTDPELGILAPRTEVSEKTERKSTVARLIESILQNDPRPPERIPQNEHQPARTPEPATIPTLQATADNLHNPHEHTKTAPKELRHPEPNVYSQRQPTKEGAIPTEAAHSTIVSSAAEGPPHFAFAVALAVVYSPNFQPTKKLRHPDRSRRRSGGTPAFRFCRCLFSMDARSQEIRLNLGHDHSWLLYPMPASTPRI